MFRRFACLTLAVVLLSVLVGCGRPTDTVSAEEHEAVVRERDALRESKSSESTKIFISVIALVVSSASLVLSILNHSRIEGQLRVIPRGDSPLFYTLQQRGTAELAVKNPRLLWMPISLVNASATAIAVTKVQLTIGDDVYHAINKRYATKLKVTEKIQQDALFPIFQLEPYAAITGSLIFSLYPLIKIASIPDAFEGTLVFSTSKKEYTFTFAFQSAELYEASRPRPIQ